MPEIIFNGPEGRLEGRYVQKATEETDGNDTPSPSPTRR